MAAVYIKATMPIFRFSRSLGFWGGVGVAHPTHLAMAAHGCRWLPPHNALVAYLACISRKLRAPLAVLIQSTSAAGKSLLMDTVLALVPREDRVHYSAIPGSRYFTSARRT